MIEFLSPMAKNRTKMTITRPRMAELFHDVEGLLDELGLFGGFDDRGHALGESGFEFLELLRTFSVVAMMLAPSAF